MNKDDKVKYVKSQGQTRNHHCHWPGCNKQVPPAMWGCYAHWMKLPKVLRDKIWAAFRPGQETNLAPSREYMAVAQEVQEWIEAYKASHIGE
jgi:CDP-diacylglycerol pyrophosphatase